MKPFNLEEAKAGKTLITRDGREVEFIDYVPSAKDFYRVVCLVNSDDGNYVYCFNDNGKYTDEPANLDLFMYEEPVKKSLRYLWIFRMTNPQKSKWNVHSDFMTEKEALEEFNNTNYDYEFFKMEETARELDD